jgi:hypothetical protein
MTKRQRFDPKEIRNVILDLQGLALGVEFHGHYVAAARMQISAELMERALASVSVVVKQN